MYTAADYTNSALLSIGADPIQSFDDGSTEAEVARIIYPQVVDYLLASHCWSFAEHRATLAVEGTDVSSEFDYSFTIPQDCLRILAVIDDTKPPYRVVGRSIAIDTDECEVLYLRRVPEQWFPPFFQHALVKELAARFCMPLTQDAGTAEMLARDANIALRMAKHFDATQDTPRFVEDLSLITVRSF